MKALSLNIEAIEAMIATAEAALQSAADHDTKAVERAGKRVALLDKLNASLGHAKTVLATAQALRPKAQVAVENAITAASRKVAQEGAQALDESIEQLETFTTQVEAKVVSLQGDSLVQRFVADREAKAAAWSKFAEDMSSLPLREAVARIRACRDFDSQRLNQLRTDLLSKAVRGAAEAALPKNCPNPLMALKTLGEAINTLGMHPALLDAQRSAADRADRFWAGEIRFALRDLPAPGLRRLADMARVAPKRMIDSRFVAAFRTLIERGDYVGTPRHMELAACKQIGDQLEVVFTTSARIPAGTRLSAEGEVLALAPSLSRLKPSIRPTAPEAAVTHEPLTTSPASEPARDVADGATAAAPKTADRRHRHSFAVPQGESTMAAAFREATAGQGDTDNADKPRTEKRTARVIVAEVDPREFRRQQRADYEATAAVDAAEAAQLLEMSMGRKRVAANPAERARQAEVANATQAMAAA